MRSTLFGHSPLPFAVMWFLASMLVFVLAMNHAPSAFVITCRWVAGAFTLYGACDLAVRVNRYRW